MPRNWDCTGDGECCVISITKDERHAIRGHFQGSEPAPTPVTLLTPVKFPLSNEKTRTRLSNLSLKVLRFLLRAGTSPGSKAEPPRSVHPGVM
jgi:hypothetical protein